MPSQSAYQLLGLHLSWDVSIDNPTEPAMIRVKYYGDLKPSSQYIARDASRPEVIIFSMALTRRDAEIEFISIPASRRV